jgi:NADPH2:quinone reductase
VPQYLAMPFINLLSSKKIRAGVVSEASDDLQSLVELALAGHLRAVIGGRFPLAEAREAHRAAETPHKTGNIVLRMI